MVVHKGMSSVPIDTIETQKNLSLSIILVV